MPYDRGAHWLHVPDINPLAKLAPRGFEVYPAPPGQKLRIGRRNAREGEMEDYLSSLVRANRAIQDASRGKTDVTCMQALPKDLGEWRPAVEFFLGPFGCGKNLRRDLGGGFRALGRARRRLVLPSGPRRAGREARLRADGAAQAPVTRMQSTRNFVEIDTGRGRINARAAIVTVSTAVLAADKIKFTPELPKRHLDAIAKLTLGSYDHVALELKGNPLQLRNDDLVFEKASGAKTAALLANVSGTPLAMVEVAGKFGAELAKAGEAAMTDFATRMACRPVRRRRQEGDRQDARDALEQRAVGARRILGRGGERRSRAARC